MSPADANAANQARTCGPDADTIRRSLPDLGDGLQGQLQELSKRPSIERIDTVARNLEGLSQVLRRYRERMIAEGEGHGQ